MLEKLKISYAYLLKNYPFNLATDIYKDDVQALKISVYGIEDALNILGEVKPAMLRYRYYCDMTYESIGKILGFTEERVNEIVDDALLCLRNPFFTDLLQAGPYIEKESREEKPQMLDHDMEPTENNDLSVLTLPIEELNTSTRAYNCMYRAGVHTIGDIVNKLEQRERIRNMGITTVMEVKELLDKLGIKIKYELPK